MDHSRPSNAGDPSQYKKEKCIGKGSFGTVYLCTAPDGSKYVIKEVEIRDIEEDEVTKSCKEARILSSLCHPNVVQYFGHQVLEKKLCIVMEYAPGGDLSTYIQKMLSDPSEEEVLPLFCQLVAGLAYIHSKGIIHQDLCAKNVLVGRGRILKLSDFGVSRHIQSISSGGIVGKPSSFAPELCWGRGSSQAADIWSLGCLLYQLACGRPPFPAPSLAGLVAAVTAGPRPALPASFPRLGPLLGRLLARSPESRPSAEQLMADPVIAVPLIQAAFPAPPTLKDFEYFGIL